MKLGILLFSFKGEVILANPLTILWIAIPLFIQANLIFWLGYGLARLLKLSYRDAAPAAMIGASNHFEVTYRYLDHALRVFFGCLPGHQ
jgi:ACR3 family arsenite transporter